MSKSRIGNFFEDFEPGQMLRHGVPRTLSEGDRTLYIGLTGSRSALNTAATTASALGLRSAPMEDLLVFNVVFGKTVPELSLNAIANLGYADARFLRPVHAGDTLAVTSQVLGTKENSSGKSGVVYVRSIATNQRDEAVLTFVRWVMVHKRAADGAAAPALPVPPLPSHVDASRLIVPAFIEPASVTRVTGFDDLWEDYAAGERIDHIGSMTVNDSDHSIAARLYQNTAKAHFDAHLMAQSTAGQRLVYGGHVMSICRSLAYDGLENCLGMLAINGGSHVAPVFAGDTLSCVTQVMETYALSGQLGALRLRTIGAKNVGTARAIALPDANAPKSRFPAEVVLDLDYTVVIPKKQLRL
ncbi:MaoC family dehydratase [Variovorax sp. 770b2]|uniref:MaoC family dehydratase n=1 Tax=Variovorax sp. 770b2 TaxID=1566271 RepID=UPI0008E3E59E|nr:MaoC family dehydratase [Variovorax sp. 770b2]SFP91837.1 L-erythro-3-methylmalyl-CoA dehydratase [Variovorax sp. 770b2]